MTLTFRELHEQLRPLLLPNAWDVSSALAFVAAGYPAIGTTSFGVNAAAGHADGSGRVRDVNRDLARRLATLPCHVSVDVENGYSDDPGEVAAYVAELGSYGVAGVNLEDSAAGRLVAPAAVAAKVAAVKAASPDTFINARVDTYWLGQDAGVAATLERAAAYVAAGADGVFVPGTIEPADLRELTGSIPVPVNVLVDPARSLDDLGGLGVRRVSTGSLPYRAAVDAAVAAADAVRDGRDVPAATSYHAMQARLVEFEGQPAR